MAFGTIAEEQAAVPALETSPFTIRSFLMPSGMCLKY